MKGGIRLEVVILGIFSKLRPFSVEVMLANERITRVRVTLMSIIAAYDPTKVSEADEDVFYSVLVKAKHYSTEAPVTYVLHHQFYK